MPEPNREHLDDCFMRTAIFLATKGRGRVEPNPLVGCVLTRDDRIIGQGYHQQFGGPHAEPNALADAASRGQSPQGATAYVTLEPCCHTNKKTPPCVSALIAAGISRVVVGTLDPNPQVNGQGLAQLRQSGITVDGPVLEAESKQLLAPFLARVLHSRPYVTVKWAQTADGKIAGPGGQRLQISNPTSTQVVHQLRGRCDAILVGIFTAIADDPLLTARDVPAARPLLRILLDSGLSVPLQNRLVTTADQGPVRIFCSDASLASRGEQMAETMAELRWRGIDVKPIAPDPLGGVSLAAVFSELADAPLTHMLVEPGPTLASSFFRDNLVDRLWIFQSPNSLNDPTAPAAATVPPHFTAVGSLDLDGDTLTEYLNTQSPVFFSAAPSPDFLLTRQSTS